MSSATYVNFREIWQNEGRELASKPSIREEIDLLECLWQEIIDFNEDEGFPPDAMQAELRLVNFEEKMLDCDWLIEHFEPCDLVHLQLAVCRHKFPKEFWKESERYGHFTITNATRTLVCDLVLQNEVSASASLAIGGVRGAPVTAESVKYMEERVAREQAVLEKLKALTEKHRASKFL